MIVVFNYYHKKERNSAVIQQLHFIITTPKEMELLDERDSHHEIFQSAKVTKKSHLNKRMR
jgi:hypothetical protein